MKYLPFFVFLFFLSCEKEFDTTNTTEHNPNKSIYVESSLTLIVTDERGEPVESSTLIDGITYQSNNHGLIHIPSLLLAEKGQNFTVSASGYFDAFKSIIPEIGRNLYMEVALREKEEERTFEAAVGADFEDRRLTISIPPNALVTAEGEEYSDQARVILNYISESLYASMYRTATNPIIQREGQSFALIPMGGVDIQFQSLSGDLLSVAEGKKIGVVTSNSATPIPITNDLRLYEYDTDAETWIDLGETPQDNTLEGDLIRTELSKAGVFIWAEEVEVNLAKFQVVTSTGVPMRNSFVITQSAYYNPLGVGHTDRDGWVRIPVYKADRNVIGLFVDCNPIIYNKDYYIDEALDGEVYVGADPFVVDENDFNIITGQAIDCDGNAINNALVEHNKRGPRYVPVDDEGKFQLVVADCVESRDYNVLDLNRGGQSKTRSIVIKSDVDLHEVIICDETEYFVNIENNATYYLFDSNQSFNSNKNGSIYEGTITAQGQSTNSEISIHFTSDKAFEQGSYSVSTWKVVNSNGGAQLNEDCSADCEGTLRINEINTSFVEGVLVIKNLPNNEEYTGVFRLPIQ